MSMYHVIVSQGENNRQEIFKSESFLHAKTAAENYKRDTGVNCHVESRVQSFTTSTLEDALAEAGHLTAATNAAAGRTMADRTAEHKAAGFTPGNMGTPAQQREAAHAARTVKLMTERPPMGNPNGFGGRSYEDADDRD